MAALKGAFYTPHGGDLIMGFAYYVALRLQLIGRQLNLSKINCSDCQSLMIGYSRQDSRPRAVSRSRAVSRPATEVFVGDTDGLILELKCNGMYRGGLHIGVLSNCMITCRVTATPGACMEFSYNSRNYISSCLSFHKPSAWPGYYLK